MNAFEWIVAIVLIIVAVILGLVSIAILGFELLKAALDARDELERGDSGKAGKEHDTEA